MKEFVPLKACQYAEAVAFPRAVGTQGETAAREKIASLFEGIGLQIETHPFSFSTAPSTILAIEIFTSQILILTTVGLQLTHSELAVIPAILLVLLISLTGLINRSVQVHSLAPRSGETPSLMSKICYSFGRRYSTANILAKFSSDEHDSAAPHLLLVAHLDSKSQRISLVVRITLFTVSICGGLLFVVLTIIGFALPAVKICSYAVAAVILIASLPLLFLDFGNSSRGAIDNASGVGLLLHLAEVLAAHPPIHGRVNITFLITSAEELGTMGAQVFVIDHENALREQAWSGGLFVLNVDGIGVAGDMYLVSLHRRAAAQDNLSLLDLVRDSCARLGVRLRDFRLPGALFDHIPFAAAGFEAVSLITIGANSRYVHSPGDTADKLAPSGFDQAGRAALMVIERLSDMEKNEPS